MAQFTHVDSFHAPVAQVGALLSSQELWSARQEAVSKWAATLEPGEAGALPGVMKQLEVASVQPLADGASRLAFSVTVSPQVLGSAAALAGPLLKGDLRAHVTEEWHAPAPDGSRTGTVEIRIASPQVTVTASLSLYPTETGCQRRLSGDVTVNVPLLGAVLANKAASQVGFLSSADAAVVRSLL